MFRYIFIFISLTTSALLALAAEMPLLKPPTISRSHYQVGNSWTWSYSEYNSGEQTWQAPYLYETYRVTEVRGDLIEIEMSSSESLEQITEAHHKFVANVKNCLYFGQKSKSMPAWKIAFYSKSFGPDWQLVSRNHSGLAFTEKFNCESEAQHLQIATAPWVEQEVDIFQLETTASQSWYMTGPGNLKGVTRIREVPGYRVELVRVSN